MNATAGYDLTTVRGRQHARRDAEDEAIELWAEATTAARKAASRLGYDGGANQAAVALALASASQASAAVARMLDPNGRKD